MPLLLACSGSLVAIIRCGLLAGLLASTFYSSEALDIGSVELAPGYNALDRPKTIDGTPLRVNVSLNLRNILEVNEKKQYISLETTLRMIWQDSRISPGSNLSESEEYVSLNGKAIESIWIPDIFIDQAMVVRSPTVQVHPSTLRVYRGGWLRYAARVNYDVSCNMDFHRYPIDAQTCEIKYESFGYTSEDMEFVWIPENCNVNTNITLDQFESEVVFESSYSTDYYETSFPGVILRIYLRRLIYYHLIQTYVPSFLFVTISWLSLFLNPEAIPGRVSMVMMTLLTLMAMFAGVRQNTPKVSYISLLDIWMVMCILFIFLTLIEFSLVSGLIRKGKRSTAENIEHVGIILIPIIFLGFNCFYWVAMAM